MMVHHQKVLVTAALAATLGLVACSPFSTTDPTPDAKDSAMSTVANGCTGEGKYTVATSAVGPVPGLPASTLGAGHTPKVGLLGTKTSADAPTVSLMVWADEPKPSTDETFKDLGLGDELSFRGYTLKITSICSGSAQFDLVSQAE